VLIPFYKKNFKHKNNINKVKKVKPINNIYKALIFIVLTLLQWFIIVAYSFTYIRQGPSGFIAFFGLLALFISFTVVKILNKKNIKVKSTAFSDKNFDLKYDKLNKLSDLHKNGVLSDEEFQKQKDIILNS
jgi:amino acid permease